MKILILGSSGMLGTEVKNIFSDETLILPDEKELDITDEKLVVDFITKEMPEVIINCAAYTNVDGCEKDENKDVAFKVNGYGPGYIAKGAKKIGAKLVHISTDYVFAGDKDTPYETDDPVDPVNVYGETKLLGEEEIKNNCDEYYILRTAWLYGENGPNFIDTMLRLGKEKGAVSVVNDQYGSPTNVKDLAKGIKNIISKDEYGIYHMTNHGFCSWYDLAVLIFKYAEMDVKVTPVSSKEFIRPAKRPNNSRMNDQKLLNNGYNILRNYEDAVKEFIEESLKAGL